MIELVDVTKKYGSKKLFENFNLSVKKGDKILLDAPSGKGKTTLVKLLLGFERPDKGEIYINNLKISRANLKNIRSQISYVSQDVDFMENKVTDLLDTIFKYKVNDKCCPENKEIIALFTKFGLDRNLLSKNVKELSGGERQRLGLIVCILLNRPIWLLDEVTASLDRDLKKTVVDEVLCSESTVIVISHDKYWHDANNIKVVRL